MKNRVFLGVKYIYLVSDILLVIHTEKQQLNMSSGGEGSADKMISVKG